MAVSNAKSAGLPTESSAGASGLPLWKAPAAWLQPLVNRESFKTDLPNLMAANWAMCEAVLRCMGRWRLTVKVRVC